MSSAESTEGVELAPETNEGLLNASDRTDAEAPAGARPTPFLRQKSGLLERARRVPGEVWILASLALLTRFAALTTPRKIVFDELYFREFALHYKAGTYYFDLHPPLGKLLLGAWGLLVSGDATATNKDPAVLMRMLPAFAGAALVVAVYYLLRQLGAGRRVATFAAALLLLENAILVESRLILMDSMLLLFGILGVTFALASLRRTGRAHWWTLAAAATFGGMAGSIKFTGLACLGLVGVVWLAGLVRRKPPWRQTAAQFALLAAIPATIYIASFAIHFAALPKTGPGDAFMSQKFQSTLQGNPNFKSDEHLSFVGKFKDLNSSIHTYELSLNDSTHPYESKWYSWPIMKRGIYAYVETADISKARYIYILGNPFVWWGTLLGAAVVLGGWALRPKRFAPYKWPLLFLAFAWFANFVPFALITRPMFLYHYFFALIFSIGFVAVGLGALLGWHEERARTFSFSTRASGGLYWGLLAGALLVFLYFAPISYGIPITTEGLDHRMWLSSWR